MLRGKQVIHVMNSSRNWDSLDNFGISFIDRMAPLLIQKKSDRKYNRPNHKSGFTEFLWNIFVSRRGPMAQSLSNLGGSVDLSIRGIRGVRGSLLTTETCNFAKIHKLIIEREGKKKKRRLRRDTLDL